MYAGWAGTEERETATEVGSLRVRSVSGSVRRDHRVCALLTDAEGNAATSSCPSSNRQRRPQLGGGAKIAEDQPEACAGPGTDPCPKLLLFLHNR